MKLGPFLRLNAPWLAAGGLLTFLSSFGQTFFISIFAGEIRSEFGLSHGEWGGIYSLGTTTSAIVMIWAGALTDRFRVRGLGALILLALAGACIAMASVKAAWALVFVIFALRFTGQGMTSHIAVVAMARWFVATRGRALAIATLGFSVGEALLPVLFVALMAFVDWRVLWIIAAIIALAGIPVLSLLLRNERTPQSMAHENPSLGMFRRHWTRNQTLRHPLFWFMVPALLGPSAFGTALFFHQVHYAEIKGWEHVQLVSLFPLYTLFGIGSMLISGWALDRFGTPRLMPFFQLPMVLAFVAFGMTTSISGALIGFFFMALTTGANSTLPNAFWAEFYGTQNIGSIKAMAAAVMVFGSAIGPGITGVLIDLGMGWDTQMVAIAAYFVLTTVMMTVGITRYKTALIA
ncbi:MFS transporter [Sulfitobacter sp. JL08]|uniref:MFS transporter n=1 Tax=Sulfitobacter sp. JL08 TaxID=2070369 RepID=UPI000E0B36EC|nr:MFS transporter [Sulfitobacter sp. JL08]AXI56605.1 MFS transporter [Sulfitobacter sp. JL08]